MATRIHKVYGKTPKEARIKAQREFGDEISIVRTRRVSPNKLQPNKGATYELTISVDSEATPQTPLLRTPPKKDEPDPDELKEAISRVNAMITAKNYAKHSTTPTPDPPSETEAVRESLQQDHSMMDLIGNELSEIRDVLHVLLSSAKSVDAPDLPDEVSGLYRKFIKHDVDQTLAHDLASAMWDCFQDESSKSIHQHLTDLISRIVKIADGIDFASGKPTVVALTGPTGVGKTTTIAKLAVQYRMKKKRVALITTDDFRIGAIEQLGTYAEILSLPMEVAHNPEELEEKIAQHQNADLILIDTPGRSQLDSPRIRLIESFLHAANPTETFLLLNMTTRNPDLQSMIERFSTIGIDKLIFTKLDEATCYGPILNCGVRHKKPIAYITTGQDVATDIEVADHSRIATFLLRGFQKKVKNK